LRFVAPAIFFVIAFTDFGLLVPLCSATSSCAADLYCVMLYAIFAACAYTAEVAPIINMPTSAGRTIRFKNI